MADVAARRSDSVSVTYSAGSMPQMARSDLWDGLLRPELWLTFALFDIRQRTWSHDLLDFIDPRLAALLPPLSVSDQPRGLSRAALAGIDNHIDRSARRLATGGSSRPCVQG